MCWIIGAFAVAVIVVLLVHRAWLDKSDRRAKRQANAARPARSTSKPFRPPPLAAPMRTPGPLLPLTWFGPDTTLVVAGFSIRDPCTYASANPAARALHATDPSELLMHAPVKPPRGPMPEIGYWPWYARLAPEHRYGYLSWLASGKTSLPREEGYLFLYYYGLERRLFVDRKDRTWVVKEVSRLRSLCEADQASEHGSFRGYSSGLLWFELAHSPEGFDERAFARLCARTDDWTEEVLTAVLVWLAAHRKRLSVELALRVAESHPRSMRSVVVGRVGREFRELFKHRFEDRYGAGIVLTRSSVMRPYEYQTASSSIGQVRCEVPDPWHDARDLDALADMWNSCIDDLRKLSRVEGTSRNVTTIDAWEALPPELRAGVDHPLQDDLHRVVSSVEREHGEFLVPVGRLAALLSIPQRPKLTPAQSRRLAEVLEGAGYCIEPDVRLASGTYEWNVRTAIFLRDDDSPIDRGRYLSAAAMLRLGMHVALADGSASDDELRVLELELNRVFQLTPAEQRRLESLRALLLRQGSDITPVAKLLSNTASADGHRSLGRLLIAIAAAGSGVEQAELVALRRCFRALGLRPKLVDETIAELSDKDGDDMVSVQPALGGAEAGERIERPAPEHAGLRLNHEAIGAIMAETQDVARLLAEAMAGAEDADVEAVTSPAGVVPTTSVTAVTTVTVSVGSAGGGGIPSTGDMRPLPPRYQAFYQELVLTAQWPRAEAEALARRHGLMLSGAVEAVNDWAFETLGTQLVEEGGDALSVDRGLL